MKVLKIGFVGTRTAQPEATADFFERVLGLRPTHSGDDMWAFRLPDGGIAEVFGPSQNDHDPTGPVVEFVVEDVEAAADELRTAGVPIVFGPEHADDVGLAWVQFRAPDGNIYGLIEGRHIQTRSLENLTSRREARSSSPCELRPPSPCLERLPAKV